MTYKIDADKLEISIKERPTVITPNGIEEMAYLSDVPSGGGGGVQLASVLDFNYGLVGFDGTNTSEVMTDLSALVNGLLFNLSYDSTNDAVVVSFYPSNLLNYRGAIAVNSIEQFYDLTATYPTPSTTLLMANNYVRNIGELPPPAFMPPTSWTQNASLILESPYNVAKWKYDPTGNTQMSITCVMNIMLEIKDIVDNNKEYAIQGNVNLLMTPSDTTGGMYGIDVRVFGCLWRVK